MYVPDIEMHEAANLEEASALLTQHAPDVRVLAGGTDLLVDLKTGRASYAHLVSICHIADLHGISETPDGLRIGALTTVTQLANNPIVRERFAPLLDAATKMAAPQVRNAATVGGNIVSAVPCADLPPILMTMNASVETWSPEGTRTLPLDSFFVGVRQTQLRPDELLTAVIVPHQPKGFGAAYARFALREGNAIAVAGVAASLQLGGDVVSDARVALGAVAPIPKLVESAREALVGNAADETAFQQAATLAMEAAEPISDIRGSADFRREVVEVMARRALQTALSRAKEGHR